MSDGFYETREWRELRYEVLRRNGGKCQCCGARAWDGTRLHVDHIKPRSLFPELALKIENLQVLCEDCNLGKSNKDDTDWRPEELPKIEPKLTPLERRQRELAARLDAGTATKADVDEYKRLYAEIVG